MKQWYAIRSKPKKEEYAACCLSRGGLEVYLPKWPGRSRLPKPGSLEPLFPGYLFARLDRAEGDLRLARYAPGVLYVLGYDNEPTPIQDPVLEMIRTRSERACQLEDSLDIQNGEIVVICEGPFRDVEAIFDRRLTGAGRVRLFVQLLGRLSAVDIERRYIRRAQQVIAASPSQ